MKKSFLAIPIVLCFILSSFTIAKDSIKKIVNSYWIMWFAINNYKSRFFYYRG